jgi:hypothetical protein
MKMFWMLAAAASLAACHNRSEETGAAPDKGDTTAVAPADTTMKADTTKADTTGAYAPSAGVDTTKTQPGAPIDTTQNQAPPAENPPAAAPSDTTSMGRDTSSMAAPADTTQPPSPGAVAPSDSAVVNPTDTTSGQPK